MELTPEELQSIAEDRKKLSDKQAKALAKALDRKKAAEAKSAPSRGAGSQERQREGPR